VRRLALTAIALLLAACLLSAAKADVASDALVHVDAAHAAGYTGQGTTIAILDTGIDDRNAELSQRVVAEHCIVPPNRTVVRTAAPSRTGREARRTTTGTERRSRASSTTRLPARRS
jgi:hypothetical protein